MTNTLTPQPLPRNIPQLTIHTSNQVLLRHEIALRNTIKQESDVALGWHARTCKFTAHNMSPSAAESR